MAKNKTKYVSAVEFLMTQTFASLFDAHYNNGSKDQKETIQSLCYVIVSNKTCADDKEAAIRTLQEFLFLHR